MTDTGITSLDRERIRELFDLRNNLNLSAGGHDADDPYPAWHELRAKADVHPGTVHELTGVSGDPCSTGCPSPSASTSRPSAMKSVTLPIETRRCSLLRLTRPTAHPMMSGSNRACS